MTNEELKVHFDSALAAQTRHFDSKWEAVKKDVEEVREQVKPIVAVYTATTLGGQFTKAVFITLAAIGTVLITIITTYRYVNGLDR